MTDHGAYFDDIARQAQERWGELVREGIQYSRPMLDIDEASARPYVDSAGLLGELGGRDVLCPASGGGQQSAAFALLGANVTVLDLTPEQLERDTQAAQHYGLVDRLSIEQGDMRDLSRFPNDRFDHVHHAHSLGFIPDVRPVFEEAARVLRPGCHYRCHVHNPFTQHLYDNWTGRGYELRHPYADGEIVDADPYWEIESDDGSKKRVEGPREFRHTLGTVMNTLIALGFRLRRFTEEVGSAEGPPGSWVHYKKRCAPYIEMWWTLDSPADD